MMVHVGFGSGFILLMLGVGIEASFDVYNQLVRICETDLLLCEIALKLRADADLADESDHEDLINSNLYSDLEHGHSSFQRILPVPSAPPPSLHAYLRRIPRSGKYMRFGRSSKSPLHQLIKRLQASTKQTSPKQHQGQQQPFMLKTIVDVDLSRLAQYLLKE